MIRFVREEDGQDMVEYGLLCAMITLIGLAAAMQLGLPIQRPFVVIRAVLAAAGIGTI